MEDGDGNLELSPSIGSATSEKPMDEGNKVKMLIQLAVTCKSPSLIARSVSFPLVDISNSLVMYESPSPIAKSTSFLLVDISNSLDSPMCTSIPPKSS